MALFFGLSPATCNAIRPRPSVRTVDWAERHVLLPRGSEITGSFRTDLFPHVREILDCCDDPSVRRVSVQMASRLGKTVSAQVFLAKTAATNPHPMALADADERSTKRVIRRTWKLLERIAPLADQLPPSRLRGQERIELLNCEIHGAWSGSAATAADFAAYVVVNNEIDKHSRSVSEEADFPHLMAERAKGYTQSTILDLSTPSLKNLSRIEELRLSGDNRARYVPCPYCNHFQTLRMGDESSAGGLKWEKNARGESEPARAFETAWYECERCRKKIRDEHRYALLNAGLWVPEGCEIKRGKVVGDKLRPGTHASFGPLSTLHSLLPSITWGRIAQEYVEAVHAARRGNTERLRNFVNSWMGETWDPKPRKTRPHEVAERLAGDEPLGVCPPWSVFVTGAADVHGDGNDLVWQVCAWGPHARGQVIDYGICDSWDEFERLVRETEYRHADGGRPLKIARMGIDSGDGHHTETVYDFCRRVPGCVPLKGSGTGRFAEFMRVAEVNAVPGRPQPRRVPLLGSTTTRLLLYHVNHERSQRWIQALVEGSVDRDQPHFWSLCQEAAADGVFLDQLIAEYPHDERNDNGYFLSKWTRTGDNEQRDLARYNRALADLLMQNGKNWDRISRGTTVAEARQGASAGGGWFSQRRARR